MYLKEQERNSKIECIIITAKKMNYENWLKKQDSYVEFLRQNKFLLNY